MAGGVAHEINNPLAIIMGFTSALLKKTSDDKDTEILKKIQENSVRISSIVKSLRMVTGDGRKDPFELKNIRDILDTVFDITQEKLNIFNIKLKVNLPEKEVFISCRSVQLCQVLINLFSNSLYAIEEQTDAWIEISVKEVDEKVFISFSDSGAAINTDVKKKIFNYFFTTKAPGEGAGLGLSMAKTIMLEHQGDIILNQDNEHPTFILSLPLRVHGYSSNK